MFEQEKDSKQEQVSKQDQDQEKNDTLADTYIIDIY
jgi:hypothetical protein